ncbi:MAG TPA: lamin tail domain-containing protein, partial [Verrucomicrobiae bacterium]|nr:lamin tail domain-containing protein [Verrucomicrobiae bacterium]
HFCFQVRVQRNVKFFSIADMLEDGDSRWLDRVGRDPEGALYKMYNNLSSAGGNEKKTRKNENSSDLQALVNNLDESRPLATRALYAWDNIDLPQTISYFVGLALVSSQDHGHKNFYAYRDTPGTGEWMLFPWDIDLSWGRNWLDSQGYFTDTLFQDNVLNFYNSAQQGKPANRFYNLIFNNTDFRRMYLRRLRTVMDQILQAPGTPAASLKIEKRIREMMDLMDPPAIGTSDADMDYAAWPKWGNSNAMRPEAQRIIDIHLPGRRDFLFNKSAATVNGERVPAAQPAGVAMQFGQIEYNPSSGNQAEEFIQLINTNNFTLDVSNWQISGGVTHRFRPGTVVPTGGSIYVSPNVPAFRARVASPHAGQNIFVQGNYQGQLSAWGETLVLADDTGAAVATNAYPGGPSLAQRFLRVTEVMYNPAPTAAGTNGPQEFEFVELKNIGATALDLRGVRFTNGIYFAFAGGTIPTLAPGGFALVVKNPAAFRERYGAALPVAGQYSGTLDNNGERLRLEDAGGEKILEFDYNNKWYPPTDGGGYSLVIRDENALWSTWDTATSWRMSAASNGSPGADDPATAADTDGDGLPDAWELAHGLDPNSAAGENGAAGDPDHDGMTNWQEYGSGTDPKNGASYLRLSATSNAPASVTLRFAAQNGYRYTVQYSDDLAAATWRKLAEVTGQAANQDSQVNDNAPASTRFYRLAVEPAN